VEWEDAINVLDAWAGRVVVVVPYLEPGLSLAPVTAPLRVDHSRPGVVKLDMPGLPIALRRATFLEADWVPGQEERGLSVVQGGTRVDVFLEGDAPDPN
jgi:hypothetical protein